MKKLFLSAAMAVFSLGTFAQSAVGSVTLQPKVGLNIACLTDEDDASSRIGFTGGAELGYQATKKIRHHWSLDVLYARCQERL